MPVGYRGPSPWPGVGSDVTNEQAGFASAPLGRQTIVALVAMAMGIFVVANDFTALSVAVVEIEDTFSTTLNRAQWVINA